MNRHMKILEYALSSLMRRKYKNLSIVFIFSIIIAVLGSILFLTYAFKTEALEVLADAPQLLVQRLAMGRHDLIPTSYAARIAEIPGVGKVTPRYWGYYYDELTGGNYTVMAVEGAFLEGLKLLEGAMPVQKGQCALGSGVAATRLVGLGDKVFLTLGINQEMTLAVKGIFSASSQLLTNDLIIVTKEDFLAFFNLPPDVATDIQVQVFNEAEVPTVAGKVKRFLPDTRPITRKELLRTYDTLFNWRSGMILAMFAGALLAFCIFAWDKATGLSAYERRELGILKAIGWETSDILELKFWEGIVISATSFLTGTILAYVHVFFLEGTFFTPALKGWSVLFPSFRLVPYLDVYQVLVLFFLTVLPYTASTIIPSWNAAVTDPDEIMRT